MRTKTRNVDFVRPDNEAYREHSARHAQRDRHLRDTLDSGSLQRLSEPIEILLRRWLHRELPLTDRRILRYERLKRTGEYNLKFKEIDAVEIGEGKSLSKRGEIRPRRLWEFKCSSNAGAISSTGTQFRKALQPIRTRWQHPVYQHAALVAVVPDMMNLPKAPVSLDEFDPSIPEDEDPEGRLKTYFSAQDLWEWGKEAGLLGPDGPAESEPFLLEEAREEARENIRKRQHREKLKEEGVPQEDWPEKLKEDQSQEVPDLEMAQYGDPDEEECSSTMADALKDALDKDEKN